MILVKSVHFNMIRPLLIKRLGGVGVQYSVGNRSECKRRENWANKSAVSKLWGKKKPSV